MIKATFVIERETKGAVLYKEVNSQGVPYGQPNEPGCQIGTIYVRKTALNGNGVGVPKKLVVTVETV